MKKLFIAFALIGVIILMPANGSAGPTDGAPGHSVNSSISDSGGDNVVFTTPVYYYTHEFTPNAQGNIPSSVTAVMTATCSGDTATGPPVVLQPDETRIWDVDRTLSPCYTGQFRDHEVRLCSVALDVEIVGDDIYTGNSQCRNYQFLADPVNPGTTTTTTTRPSGEACGIFLDATNPACNLAGSSIFWANTNWMLNTAITVGCNPPVNDRYCPTNNVTRAQMATFLDRALGLPATSVDYFVDDEPSVHQGSINRLAESGITFGCNPPANDNFCPESSITRGQMAAFLDRAFNLPAGATGVFSDVDGSIFIKSIEALTESGITKGCNPPTNSMFCPRDAVTRGQMAAFMDRAELWIDAERAKRGLSPILPPPATP